MYCLRNCQRFPCRGVPASVLAALRNESLFVEMVLEGFTRRRTKVYVFRMEDGSLRDAPRGFSPERPDLAALEGVAEILVIGKVLEKQVRLAPKSKEAVSDIRRRKTEELSVAEAGDAKEETTRKRRTSRQAS